MHLYTKQPIFQAVQVVSYISACTELPGDKCMHHYTKLSKKTPALDFDVKYEVDEKFSLQSFYFWPILVNCQ